MNFQQAKIYIFSDDQIDGFLERLKDNQLEEKDHKFIMDILKSYQSFFQDFIFGNMSKAQIRKKIEKLIREHGGNFTETHNDDGKKDKTEDNQHEDQSKTDENKGQESSTEDLDDDSIETSDAEDATSDSSKQGKKANSDKKDKIGRNSPDQGNRNNHGQTSAEDFSNAFSVFHGIEDLKAGDSCPGCFKGTLYQYKPGIVLIMRAFPPVIPEKNTIEKLRCNACMQIVSATTRDYLTDDTIGRFSYEAVATLAYHRYCHGTPFYRLETLELQFGIRLSDSTMWDLVHKGSELLAPLFEVYKEYAANGNIIRGDDAHARVIELKMKIKEEQEKALRDGQKVESVRSGVHTSCFYVNTDHGELLIYNTGLHHTGESFDELISRREIKSSLTYMSDASTSNPNSDTYTLGKMYTVKCLQHARDRFVKLKGSFPEQCEQILNIISQVYDNDRQTTKDEMTSANRLLHHQQFSTPLLDKLYDFCKKQFDNRLVEPNSSLGKELKYLFNHWPDLTGFLTIEGAPLDNNICELYLKIPKRHLKNSLAYLSSEGASVGDLYMSLVGTAKINDIYPLTYLTGCIKHHQILAENPVAFLPWNFIETMSRIKSEQIDDPNRYRGSHYSGLPQNRINYQATYLDEDDLSLNSYKN